MLNFWASPREQFRSVAAYGARSPRAVYMHAYVRKGPALVVLTMPSMCRRTIVTPCAALSATSLFYTCCHVQFLSWFADVEAAMRQDEESEFR